MPKMEISQDTITKAIRLYRNKSLTIKEIENLTGVSDTILKRIWNERFRNGTLTPRRPDSALKPRVPNGQGTSRPIPSGVGKGGRNKEFKKFTDEQEREIAVDYYENGLTVPQMKEKWGIHPVQLQRVRNKFGAIYGKKKSGNPHRKEKSDLKN